MEKAIFKNKIPKVSVVVAVYNAESFLNHCLDTVLGQTLKDIEVICVDDASTDRSLEILKEYQKQDNRVKVLEQKHAGAGAARNKGIEASCGEYLSILDADDFFEPDMLKKAYENAVYYDADITVFRIDSYDNKRKVFSDIRWTIMPEGIPRNPFSAEDIPDRIFNIGYGGAEDKLFRRNFVQENNVRFQEIRSTNDMFFVFYLYTKANRIYVIDEVLGHYRQNTRESLSVTREKSWNNVLLALRKLQDRLRDDGTYEKHRQSFVNWALNLILWHIDTLDFKSGELLKNACREQFFEELNVWNNPKDYYYNQGEYERMIEIMEGPVKVSVIVPIYNAASYLRQCLDSLLEQTLHNIQIICVDDGSTDDSPYILQEYCKRDHRICLFFKDHSNAGDARNMGLENAVGKYVAFLDADDFAEPDMLEKAYQCVCEADADICLFRSSQYLQDAREFRETPWTVRTWEMPEHRPFSAKEVPDKIFNMSSCTPWDKIFKRQFLINNNLSFQSNTSSNDMVFTFSAMAMAERITTSEEVLCHQRIGHIRKLSDDFEYLTSNFYKALMELKRFLTEHEIYPEFKQSFVNWALDFSLFILHSYNGMFKGLVFQQLKNKYFIDLDVYSSREQDFYNHDQYLEMERIREEYERELLEREKSRNGRPKVSVVIPIYNVSRYLRLCLDSAVYQTLDNIEILCINDGSTDDCLDIINEYAENDSRIKVIDGPNRGYGHAMNAGFDHASGEYLAILEPDDFIDVRMFEELYDVASSNNLDYVKSDFNRFRHDENGFIIRYYNKVARTDQNYNYIHCPRDNKEWLSFIMNTWCGIYNRDFIEKYHIRHNETPGASYQDNGFLFKTNMYADRVMYVSKAYYMNRRDNPNSSVKSKEKVYAINKEYALLHDYLEQKKLLDKFAEEFHVRRTVAYETTIARIAKAYKKEYLRDISQELRASYECGELKQSMLPTPLWNKAVRIIHDPDEYFYEVVNKGIKVSVILAIYNQQRYLRQCLDSILNQSLKNIEIICVNDGSDDRTADILEQYAGRDDRIVVINQENKGAGAARNAAMDLASGEYLSFLDSDDFFDKDLLKLTAERADRFQTDICLFRTFLYDNQTGQTKKALFRLKREMMPKKNVFNRNDISGNLFLWANGTASDKIFRRSFVESQGLRFQEQRTTNDAYFAYAALFRANKMTVLDKELYYERRNNPASLSNTRHLSWECYYSALLKHRENLQEMGIFKEYEQDFVNYALANTLWNYKTLPEPAKSDLEKKLLDSWFDELGISGRKPEYFENKKNYCEYLGIIRKREHAEYPCQISVIMPCYNAEKYLAETLDSLLYQTFHDFEIICVNDCSDDQTLNILKDYERRFENIRVFSDEFQEQPQGPGQARNIGLSHAKGKYIYYMDSDDTLVPHCFETIHGLAEEKNLDLLYFEADTVYESEEMEEKFPSFRNAYHRNEIYPDVYTGEDLFDYLTHKGDFQVSVCLQMVRRSVIEENGIQFPKLTMHVDEVYTPYTILNSWRAACMKDALYIRRMRNDSVITKNKTLAARLKAITGVYEHLLAKIPSYQQGSAAYKALNRRIIFVERFTNNLFDKADHQDREQALNELSCEEKSLLGMARMKSKK